MRSWLANLGVRWVRVSTDKPAYHPGDELVVCVRTRGRRVAELEATVVQLVRTEKTPEAGSTDVGAARSSASGPDVDVGNNLGCFVAILAVIGLALLAWKLVLRIVAVANRAARQPPADASVVVVGEEPLGGAPPVGTGEGERTVRFVLPNPAPPSVRGRDFEIAWSVRVVGARSARPDRIATAPVVVLAARDTYARSGGRPSLGARPPVSGGACALELALATTEVMPGQRVAGRLTVLARESFRFSAVRVALVRSTESYDKKRDWVVVQRVVATGGRLKAGASREFPFELAVPPGACPSTRTRGLTVAWCLRATVARRMRADEGAAAALTVYNAPDGAG
jgi:hypothetical protein